MTELPELPTPAKSWSATVSWQYSTNVEKIIYQYDTRGLVNRVGVHMKVEVSAPEYCHTYATYWHCIKTTWHEGESLARQEYSDEIDVEFDLMTTPKMLRMVSEIARRELQCRGFGPPGLEESEDETVQQSGG